MQKPATPYNYMVPRNCTRMKCNTTSERVRISICKLMKKTYGTGR